MLRVSTEEGLDVNSSHQYFISTFLTIRHRGTLLSSPLSRSRSADSSLRDYAQFNLIEKKELAPLSELNESILSNQVPTK